jgi:hypothetical protein
MPDNAVFYYAAYIATAVVYGGYALSLAVRMRRARERERRQVARRVARGQGS